MPIPDEPSRSAVRKAGSRLRSHGQGAHLDDALLTSALQVLDAYRAQFAAPTSEVAAGLRHMCDSLDLEAKVSQRIKRRPTILEKLVREEGLDLSRMQDIGGCRVVLRSQADLRVLQQRIHEHWGDVLSREVDYIADPRSSGYRALHLIVMRGGHPVEIQLRDEPMHTWAQTVEALSALTRVNYKSDGESLVQQFMRLESTVLQEVEAGRDLPHDLVEELATLRAQVLEYVRSTAPARDGEQP